MAEHDRRGGPNALGRGAFDESEPLRRADLVWAEGGALPLVENPARRSRQRSKPRLGQSKKEFGYVNRKGLGALRYLERREGVNVHFRHCGLHGTADVQIGLAGVVGMDTALHADFGGSACPGLG